MNKKFVYQVGNNKKVIQLCTANQISVWTVSQHITVAGGFILLANVAELLPATSSVWRVNQHITVAGGIIQLANVAETLPATGWERTDSWGVITDVLATLLLVIICIKKIQSIVMICNFYSVLSTARVQETHKNFLTCSFDKDPSNKLFNWSTRAKIRRNIQGVPHATELGTSLIILTPMKILQRNRHTLQTHSSSFLSQRTYSCSNFVAISSLVLELLKKYRVR